MNQRRCNVIALPRRVDATFLQLCVTPLGRLDFARCYLRTGYTDTFFYTDTRYNDKIRYNDNLTVTKPSF